MIDLKIFLRALFCKKILHARVNLMSNNNKKIPSLRDFHSLYQLLYSQVYHNGFTI